MAAFDTSVTSGQTGLAGVAPMSSGKRDQPQGEPGQQPKTGASPATPEPQKTAPPPAVTMAPSIAGLLAGQALEGDIIGADSDGHPILETPRGRFVLDPTAGLETGMQARLIITLAGRRLEAQVVARNDLPTQPPIAVVLTLVQARGLTPAPAPTPGPIAPTTPAAAPPPAAALPDDAALAASNPQPATMAPTPLTASTGIDPSHPPLLFQRITLPQASAPMQSAPPGNSPRETGSAAASPNSKATQLAVEALVATLADKPAAPEPLALPLGAVLAARVLTPAPSTPVQTPVAADALAKTNILKVAAIAITAPDAQSPVAAPPAGTPLALLANSGRVRTFIVMDVMATDPPPPAARAGPSASLPAAATNPPQPPLLRLRHADQEIALPAAHALPVGTKVTLAILSPLPQAAPSPHLPTAEAVVAPAAPAVTPTTPPPATPIIERAAPATPTPIATPTPSPLPLAQPPLALPPPPLPRLQPQAWPALAALTPMLAEAAPQALTKLPQPGAKLSNHALFFWRALGLGSAEAWLDPAARAQLQTGDAARLWAALQRDLALLSERRHGGGGGGEWRPFSLPLQLSDGVQLLTWFVRPAFAEDHGQQQGDDPPGQPQPDGRDFVLDIDFATFGRLRLRGLVRPRRLDLTLASIQPLPQSLRASTQAVFNRSLEAAGYAGALRFETGLPSADLPVAEA